MKTITGNVAGIDFDAQLVLSDGALRSVVNRLETAPKVALDLETTGYTGQRDYGPDKGQIRLAQLAWHSKGELNVAIIDGQAADLSLLVPFLESGTEKVVHYSPFERAWINHHLECKLERVIDTCYLGQSINKKLRGDVAQEALGGGLITKSSEEDYNSLQKQLFKLADVYTLPSGREITLVEVKAAYDKAEIPLEGWKLSERATLQAMAKRYLGQEMDKEGQTSDWTGYLTDEQLIYAAGDAAVTLEICGKVSRIAKQLGVYSNMLRRVKHDLKGGE